MNNKNKIIIRMRWQRRDEKEDKEQKNLVDVIQGQREKKKKRGGRVAESTVSVFLGKGGHGVS